VCVCACGSLRLLPVAFAAFWFLPLHSRLPERTRDRMSKVIQQDYFGEQQPGTAFIVKNTGKGEKYKHVAHLCLSRVADASTPVEFAYTAMRGLILAIVEYNRRETTPIEVVAIPSFALFATTAEQKRYDRRPLHSPCPCCSSCTLSPPSAHVLTTSMCVCCCLWVRDVLECVSLNVLPEPPFAACGCPTCLVCLESALNRLITRHMSIAYRNMLYPMKHLASPEEAKILTAQLLEKTTETPAERRHRMREMLLNGELIKRGLYVEEELRFLIEMIETENDVRRTAAKTLSHFVHSSPSEFTLSIESIGSAISKSKAGLAYMLDEAEAGAFTLFKEIKPSELEFGEEIGSGTEASVFKAKWDTLSIAVKKFRGIPSTQQFQRELSIMSLVQHPNLLRCYGGYSDTKKDEYYLVMDLMDTDVHAALHSATLPIASRADNGSASSLKDGESRLRAASGGSHSSPAKRSWEIRYPQMLKIALHTARGLEYLHECNLIHRDLKSVNLLIDENFNAKVCDFGLSRVVAPKNQNMTGNVGTVSWIAPEVFEKQPYDAKADVYSFGVVMWELFTKQVPFQDMNTFEIPMAVIKGERPPIPKDCPKEYYKLMQLCWHKKPSKRPTFPKIVKTLLKLSKDILITEFAPTSPSPSLVRASPQFSQSATLLRSRESSFLNVSGSSLEESATTSSSKSEDDAEKAAAAAAANGGAGQVSNGTSTGPGPGIKPFSSKVPHNASIASFPRRRTASSANVGENFKSSSSPNMKHKQGTMRGSGEFKAASPSIPE